MRRAGNGAESSNLSSSAMKKIAIVGGGVAGMTAAHFLVQKGHKVTLHEKESVLGGHAHTAIARFGDVEVPVDTGFMVFNPPKYPRFVELLKELNVKSRRAPMLFSVSIEGEVEYSSQVPFGLFADWKNLFRPSYYVFLLEILKFFYVGRRVVAGARSAPATLTEFLDEHHFSERFRQHFLYPMLGAIWSASVSEIPQFPTLALLRFLDNHQLLNAIGQPKWQTIVGGSRVYVDALEKKLREKGVHIYVSSPTHTVIRTGEGVLVTTALGAELFDAVVCATHAPDTMRLLTDAVQEEKEALAHFVYTINTCVLHTSPQFLPKRRAAHASWNYHAAHALEPSHTLALTYYMNILQNIPLKYPLFVTLNPSPAQPIPAAQVLETYTYMHPLYTPASLVGQKALTQLQGKNKVYFAGAYMGSGFHEDGVESAYQIAQLL
jgi:uncharacterized protein